MKYIITFKPKDQRICQKDKLEIVQRMRDANDNGPTVDTVDVRQDPVQMKALLEDPTALLSINDYLAPIIIGTFDDRAVDRLRSCPDVLAVEEDAPAHIEQVGPPEVVTPIGDEWLRGGVRVQAQDLTWNMNMIRLSDAHAFTRGAGIKIGIVDTGVDFNHPDLSGCIVGGASFVPGVSSYMDDHGHGTHVTGIIGARNNTIGVLGVAPECTAVMAKVFNAQGQGSASQTIAGFEWCRGQNVAGINFSGSTSTGLASLINAMTAEGRLVVAAAGNYETCPTNKPIKYPALLLNALSVQATAFQSSTGTPCWSAVGSGAELAAPGEFILSTWRNGTYSVLSGTSMAAPHVMGLAVLWAKKWPGRTLQTMFNSLAHYAVYVPGYRWTTSIGYGRIDAGGPIVNLPVSTTYLPKGLDLL